MSFIRAYLRASTDDQDAERARDQVAEFARSYGHTVACWYIDHASGTTTERPELQRLLADSTDGDVLLVESIDRLSRLSASEWKALRAEIDAKGIHIVAADLPTSHAAMTASASDDDVTARMLDAVKTMLLDMLAAFARLDYEQKRQRQMQGIEKAKAAGKYAGRPIDQALNDRVLELLDAGMSVRKAADIAQCSTSTVQRIKQRRAAHTICNTVKTKGKGKEARGQLKATG